MLSYPWSLAQGPVSTAFNNRSCLTPSNNAQCLPKAAAISELSCTKSTPPARSFDKHPPAQSLRRAWIPSILMSIPCKLRRFKVPLSFKASASTWRSTITTGATTVLMPPSQPASKIEMLSFSNHRKIEGSGTKICHRFILSSRNACSNNNNNNNNNKQQQQEQQQQQQQEEEEEEEEGARPAEATGGQSQ